MAYNSASREGRLTGALGAGAVTLALLGTLLFGLRVPFAQEAQESLQLFEVAPDPDPPPPVAIAPNPVRDTRPEGAASPPNIRSRATEIVAPPPVLPVPVPPVVTARTAASGADATSGAAEIVGPGTGSGGVGTGTGSGGRGTGDGSGGRAYPPRRIKGQLSNSDFPEEAAALGVSGTVSVRYVVDVDGRVPDCIVTRSSGSAALDDRTCELIMKRFRFEPSRDARGRPVRSQIVENHSWIFELLPPERGPDR